MPRAAAGLVCPAMRLLPSASREPRRPRPLTGPLVLVHPSDELYGADRMLLEMVEAARSDPRVPGLEVWLPDDLAHPAPELSLCRVLEQRGVAVRHLDLPVLRRAYRTPRGLAHLLGYRLTPNFRMPYLSANVGEFWRRFWFNDQPSHLTPERIHGGIM